MNDLIPFRLGYQYSRNDIYKILEVPITKQKGNWNTGYHKYGGNWFVFAGINTAGRTGHEYRNRFIENDFEWYGNTKSKLSHPSIQSMISPENNVYIFTREDSRNLNFIYRGNARVKEFYDTTPVKIIWRFLDTEETYSDG